MTPKTKERLVGSLVLLCLAVIFIPPFYDGRNPFDVAELNPRQEYVKPPQFPDADEMANSIADIGSGRIDEIEKQVKESLPESARSDSQLEKPDRSSFEDIDASKLTTQLLDDITERAQLKKQFEDPKQLKASWALQVGSFSEVERAQKVRDDLITKNYQAYIKTVVQNGKTISRVFAGVSLDKANMEKLQTKLKKQFPGLSSLIVTYQP